MAEVLPGGQEADGDAGVELEMHHRLTGARVSKKHPFVFKGELLKKDPRVT